MGTRGKGGGRRRTGGPGAGAAAGSRAEARAARGRGRGATRSGPWVAAAVGFLALAGLGGFLVLHDGAATHATAEDAASASASAGSPSASASAAPSCTAEPADKTFPASGPKAKPLDVRVTVLNGSGTIGQAEAVLSWMQNTEKYLRTSNGGPADHQATTTLVYAPDHVDQARALVASLGLPASALHGNGTSTGARDPMVLTLGADFRGVGKAFSHC
ncbi:LytR C-terminal domain-containing protein [Streptacidiphilus anmyonensis]|uniref:LytR C-terminal domain-containing protein n=1 Tax=Streptacidiphilus anmyonensis TaxID=405782 RepID=UPI000693306C|nr:LytR C-terminal domain-containing protein [Streptacidiphilus anmyonensis]